MALFVAVQVLLLTFVLAAGLWLLFSRKHARLPPGPPGRPVLGHYGKIPIASPWHFFGELGHKYGEISSIRILGHTLIVLNAFDPADAIFNKRSNRYSHKPRRRMGELSGLVATLPFMDPGPTFTHARKMFRQELSPRSLTAYHGEVERASRQLAKAFAANANIPGFEKHIDQTLGRLFMRVSSGYVVKGDDDEVLRPIQQLASFAAGILGGTYSIIDRLPFLCYLPHWAPGSSLLRLADHWRGRLWEIANGTAELVREELVRNVSPPFTGMLTHRTQMSGSPSTSFMGNLYGNPRGGMDLDEAQFKFIAVTMSAGGMLPLTSSSLGFLAAMARFPAAQKRAQAELDALLGGSRLPTLADRPALPYVCALILELYRWAPVAPLIARKTLEDDEIAGLWIPKGATIVANNWAISRDPERYPDPQVFRPERFLPLFEDSDAEKSGEARQDILDPRSYAFGYGRRICPGLDFAEAILFANISHILTVFDVVPTGDAPILTPDGDVALKTVGAAAYVDLIAARVYALALLMDTAES
ncbi:cytochrome P450 [Fomitopsis serialis]|uniref:cytochrome P450 n=1 Tax=Fomitopsis serialis TaxID=139415 RepID=UPI00200893E3|nr:cytochrome P450 [Neoantrodia serialis]KAH9911659.1 cytochrome P450 [Neoantrodia serialis]